MPAEHSKPTSTRLSPPERVIVESAARLRGQSLSAWLREVAVAEAWEQIRAAGVVAAGSPPEGA